MEPYKPNKPWISANLPTREELIAMAMGLIPGGRALKNMHDNPEGPSSKTLDLAAEDLVHLYANLIKPAIKGQDINWRNSLIEAALIGLPLNGPRGTRRTDPKRVPIDEARTAEFNQKLNDLDMDNMSPGDKLTINLLRGEPNVAFNPELISLNRNENIVGQVLDRHGLGDYYDDIIFNRLANDVNINDFINPEEYTTYRKYLGEEDPMNVPYNYAADEYRSNYLDVNRDNILDYNTGLDRYKEIANRRNIDKPFSDFIVDYYDKDNFSYEPKYKNSLHYEFTPRRLKEKFDNGNINKQEILNEYIDRTLKPTEELHKEVLDILKSDLPKEEKKELIQGIYGEIVLPIEIEELLL